MRLLHEERGAALILVLWVTLLLTMIAAAFAASVRVEGRAALNAREEAQAQALAVAGFNQAVAELMGEWDYNALTEDGQTALVRLAGGQASSPQGGPAVREGKLGQGRFRYRVLDEERRINVNLADRKTLIRLLEGVGIASGAERDIVADSILDWIDEDSLHRLNGAEDNYYRGLTPSYGAKNGPMDSIEELRLVRGVTPEIYQLLAPYLTVWGSGKVNINTADETLLQLLFPDQAQAILAQRKAQPFVQPQFGGVVRSTAFTVETTGMGPSALERTVRGVVKLEGKDRLLVKVWDDNAEKASP